MNSNWGLVLAGGGGKGSYQIGIFRAINEIIGRENIGGISGTSVGALNAVLYICSSYENSKRIWMNISNDKFLKLDEFDYVYRGESLSGYLDKVKNDGMFSRDGLRDIIENDVDLDLLYSDDIVCYATATRYDDDKKTAEYFKLNKKSDDDILNILLASSALPLIYDSVIINGSYYKDGGLCDNIPIRPLYDEGIRKFIVLKLGSSQVFNHDDYKDATFIKITPSASIGDFFDGTVDFEGENAEYRIEMGYLDAKRTLLYHLKGDYSPAAKMKLKEQKLRDINYLNDFKRYQELNEKISSNIDKANKILDKYII